MTRVRYTPLNDLSTLAVGDRVIVQAGAGVVGKDHLGNVVKITKTLVTVKLDNSSEEYRFSKNTRKKTGTERGRFGWVHDWYVTGKVTREVSE
jgi:preprotein translocase subunit YajC